MKLTILAVITVGLLAGPTAALADPIQSGTTVNLTFRTCIQGATACDSLSPAINTYAGFPGDQTAQANESDPNFGATSGSAELDGGTAGTLSATASSLSGKRNGGNSATLQRYTNVGSVTETLTLNAVLSYDQVVPSGNAGFPASGQSSASAYVFIFSTSDESIEAGDTEESNWQAVFLGNFCGTCTNPPPSNYQELDADFFGDSSNATGAGTMTRTLSVDVDPGESVWIGAQLQSLAANGAVVDATLNTNLSSNVYSCVGFEPPADRDVSVKKPNRVVPLRMTLLDGDGQIVFNIDSPVVNVAYEGSYTYGPSTLEELNYAGRGDEGNMFQFDGSKWAFNLSTRGLASGEYTITAVSGGDYVIDPSCEVVVTIQ